MTYKEFNAKALAFYRARSHSSFCALSIDQYEMEQIAHIDELKNFNEIKKDWVDLLRTFAGVPQYFGLLAIQCYAAGQMHFDGRYTATAYNIRLEEVLGLEHVNLTQLYSAKYKNRSVQEAIWLSAAAYFKTHLNQNLQIPEPTVMAGRYVQFPKSQALLNIEDLKRFTTFFRQEFRKYEVISFNYFQQRLEAVWLNINLTKRAENLFKDETKYLPCLKQLFNYWSSWNGEVYDSMPPKAHSRSSGAKTLTESNPQQLILIIEDEVPTLYLKYLNDGRVIEHSVDEIFNIDHYENFHDGMFFFNLSECGYGEYLDSRMLQDGVEAWIILDLARRPNEAKLFEGTLTSLTLSDNLVCYQWNSRHLSLKKWVKHFFQEPSPIRLEGGVRLNGRREFLKGFGPQIICSTEYKMLYRNEVHPYDPSTAVVGLYKVRSDFFTDVEFEIVAFDIPSTVIESSESGWNWIDYEVVNGGRWNGCKLRIEKQTANYSLSRLWIQVNLGQPYHGEHPLLKNIANFKRR